MGNSNDKMPSDLGRHMVNIVRNRYILVGAHRVKPWYAWTLVGFAAGITVALVLVMSRAGDVALTGAASTPPPAPNTAIVDQVLPQDPSPFNYRTETALPVFRYSGTLREKTPTSLSIDA